MRQRSSSGLGAFGEEGDGDGAFEECCAFFVEDQDGEDKTFGRGEFEIDAFVGKLDAVWRAEHDEPAATGAGIDFARRKCERARAIPASEVE
jgi:hypothetical protein